MDLFFLRSVLHTNRRHIEDRTSKTGGHCGGPDNQFGVVLVLVVDVVVPLLTRLGSCSGADADAGPKACQIHDLANRAE